MIIVDKWLQRLHAEGRPIRVGMVGAGFMGRGIALQMALAVPGMELVAIANRHLEAARRAFEEAGQGEQVRVAETVAEAESIIARGGRVIGEDPAVVCQTGAIDAVIEVTGTVDYAAGVVLDAIRHGKHVVLMNTEVDGTVGPILKVYADRAGVVISNTDGDQPGLIMNLYRMVRGIGVRPVLCGSIKGLQDPHRTPANQAESARRWGQSPAVSTAFADGTEISFEQAVVANATGMRVARRGMYGPTVEPGTFITDAVQWFPTEALMEGPGIVDYVVGAEPAPGVFVIGTHDHPLQRRYLDLYKLGEGPLYCFYRPHQLYHFEVHNAVARAVLFGDAAIAPANGPCVEVVAVAKSELPVGQTLDGIGGYMTYGQCENADVVAAERLLPIGVAAGCRLRNPVSRDRVLTYDDVEVPAGRLCDQLREEQADHFAPLECAGGTL